MRRWVLILLGLLLFPMGHATPRIRFETLYLETGQSLPLVQSVVQDQVGFMWIATINGLFRYDGSTFETFKSDPDDPYSLTDVYVRALLVDREDRLWVGTYGGGLNLYDRRTGRFLVQELPDGIDQISALAQGADGRIWIATFTHQSGAGLRGVQHGIALGFAGHLRHREQSIRHGNER